MIMPKNYTLQNASNLGWLFYKDYYRQEPNVDFISTQGKESDTTADFFRKTNQRITAYQLNSESPLVAAFNNHFGTPLQLKTIYPGLITGSGLPHQTGSKGEFKLGFQFDYTTGLPYIPGSSIKGTLRSMFPFSLKDKGSTKRIIPEYRKERMEYIRDLIIEVTNINEISDTEIQALEYAIFTNSTPSGKTIEFSLEEKDVFYDAFVADSKDGVMLSDDYITPHGENPLKDPKPILFLKIRPDVTINFYFKLCTTHLYKEKVCSSKQIEEIKKQNDFSSSDYKMITAHQKRNLFEKILLCIGIGAKTNIGYGQLKKL